MITYSLFGIVRFGFSKPDTKEPCFGDSQTQNPADSDELLAGRVELVDLREGGRARVIG